MAVTLQSLDPVTDIAGVRGDKQAEKKAGGMRGPDNPVHPGDVPLLGKAKAILDLPGHLVAMVLGQVGPVHKKMMVFCTCKNWKQLGQAGVDMTAWTVAEFDNSQFPHTQEDVCDFIRRFGKGMQELRISDKRPSVGHSRDYCLVTKQAVTEIKNTCTTLHTLELRSAYSRVEHMDAAWISGTIKRLVMTGGLQTLKVLGCNLLGSKALEEIRRKNIMLTCVECTDCAKRGVQAAMRFCDFLKNPMHLETPADQRGCQKALLMCDAPCCQNCICTECAGDVDPDVSWDGLADRLLHCRKCRKTRCTECEPAFQLGGGGKFYCSARNCKLRHQYGWLLCEECGNQESPQMYACTDCNNGECDNTVEGVCRLCRDELLQTCDFCAEWKCWDRMTAAGEPRVRMCLQCWENSGVSDDSKEDGHEG